jgi:acetyltransferase-like isoleucine patch superfamily enzyme
MSAVRTLLRRLVRAPRALWLAVADRFFTPLWLRILGVRLGRRCRFYGLPIITMARDATIVLGDDVVIRSRADSNVAGIAHPTILAAMERNSTILIGPGTGISGASIVARRSVAIGNRVLIGAGACVWDTDFHPVDAARRRVHPTRHAATAPVRIEDEAFIGARALVLKGVTVGARAAVGAGAVVTKDVEADTIVGGNPARVIGTLHAPVEGEFVS